MRKYANYLWPVLIIVSALGASLVTWIEIWPPVRAWVVFWFLLVIPGMSYVRLLGIKDIFAQWILAIALSLSVDAIVAALLLYAGAWWPLVGLMALVMFSLFGAGLQLAKLAWKALPLLVKKAPVDEPGEQGKAWRF